MKKIIFGALVAFSVMSCGENTTEVVEETTVNSEAIIEMESATEEVVVGLEEMETEVDVLAEDIDNLLNEI